MSQGTPASSQIIALEKMVADRESIIDAYALDIAQLKAELEASRAQRDAALAKFKECSDELSALRAQEPVGTVFCSAGDFNFVPSAALPMDGDWALYAAPAPAAVPDYSYSTVEEYERLVGFNVSDAFRIGWRMARTTDATLAGTQEGKP